MESINWGIIGCGDVTELKSGPAFNKVPYSKLVAVMRRDGAKAKDYAQRHQVPRWYDDATSLINDPEVNAIYIATPPDSHEAYALQSIEAGKPVYLEKPMTLNHAQALNIAQAANKKMVKLSVAHYRRGQAYFKKIKSLIDEKVIGETRFARLSLFEKPLSAESLKSPKISWRVDPGVSGGGLFHDLSPHQLDLAYYFFGEPAAVQGITANQSKIYAAEDIVTGNIFFKSGVVFSGLWCFNAAEQDVLDIFEIVGSEGRIEFCVFGKQFIRLIKNGLETIIPFEAPKHVQQPMIEEVVNYFLEKGPNPCSAEDGAIVMAMIDEMSNNNAIKF